MHSLLILVKAKIVGDRRGRDGGREEGNRREEEKTHTGEGRYESCAIRAVPECETID